jgi:hypothetical protein
LSFFLVLCFFGTSFRKTIFVVDKNFFFILMHCPKIGY